VTKAYAGFSNEIAKDYDREMRAELQAGVFILNTAL